jgi:hypothetical protein
LDSGSVVAQLTVVLRGIQLVVVVVVVVVVDVVVDVVVVVVAAVVVDVVVVVVVVVVVDHVVVVVVFAGAAAPLSKHVGWLVHLALLWSCYPRGYSGYLVGCCTQVVG